MEAGRESWVRGEVAVYFQKRRVRVMNNVVLVHGGFVDGSRWGAVYKILTRNGYKVTVVQNPTISLDDDVAYTKRALAAQDGPAILVGHSYGGAVISEAGNDPKVAGLVSITAFAPDKGESVATLIDPPPRGASTADIAAAKTAFCSSIRQSFTPLSLQTWTPKRPRSWRIPKCRGA
jgi:pimeloyl-ACP methyl ester carboxylesterase